MLKQVVLALTALSLLVAPAHAKKKTGGFNFIEPAAFDAKHEVLVSGKLREYYLLDEGGRIDVQVKGPSRLKVLSRVVLPANVDSVEYSYLALRKKSRKALTFDHSSRVTDKVGFAGEMEGAVGLSRSKIIDVPRGEQAYTFYLPKDAKYKVLLRFAVETNAFTRGTSVVPMTPNVFSKEIDLVAREEAATYYRIGTGYDVTLELIGPATLKVLSRIEFDQNMNGKQKWKVRVLEDGKVKGTYSLSGRRSQVTTYRELSSLVPSKAEVFYVEVPKGKHRYEFVLPDNHRTVLMKFLLPKGQLERE